MFRCSTSPSSHDCFGGFADALPALPGPRHEDDPMAILFTSGSSGMPKGVELSFRGVVANQQNVLVRSRQLPHLLNPDAPQAVNLVCTPLFHVGALATLLSQVITGGRIVLNVGRFNPAEVLALIEAEGVQRWGGVPTMAVRVIEHPDFDSYDLSSLRAFPLGGAAVSPVLLERMARKLPQLQGRGLANTWGMTEGAGFFTVAGGAELTKYPSSVGRPYPTVELKILDPDDRGVGEVAVRSPTVMLGYVGIDARPSRFRGLVAHRGSRSPQRRGVSVHRRPQQGHGDPRRGEHRLPARRGGTAQSPRRGRGRRDRTAASRSR